ncbi:reverse transcriptase [Trichonephila clavipes]|nr:reverse transcriptase [Trichonephila clavipes]
MNRAQGLGFSWRPSHSLGSSDNGDHCYTFSTPEGACCRTKIAELISYGWTAALQWVPSHVGIPGNERADQKAKQGAELTQPEVPLILRRAKSIISTYFDKYIAVTQNPRALESYAKSWPLWVLFRGTLERAEAVARFRLTTRQDFLEVYLLWLGLAADEACSFCGHARMDGDHLLQGTELVEYPADDIVSRY